MRLILTLLLSSITLGGLAQSTSGFQVGIGASATYLKPIIPTPDCEFFYLRNLSNRFAIGGMLGVQRYSFTKGIEDIGSPTSYGVLSVTQKSTYMYIGPKAEVGFGKHQKIHAAVSAGLGKLIDANQTITAGYGITFNGSLSSTTVVRYKENTVYNVASPILVSQISLSENVVTIGHYYCSLFEEFSFIPSYVSKARNSLSYFHNSSELFIKTNYFSCGICVVHKYSRINKPGRAKKAIHRHPYNED